MTKTVLVIDDEAALRMMMRAIMESSGWQVREAESGVKAVAMLAETPNLADVVLLDMRMPGMDGHETLAKIHEIQPSLPVVMLTAYGTVGSAVDAMKRGAFDYITKPADNDELITVLEKGYQYSRLLNENAKMRKELDDSSPVSGLVGNSASMRRLHDFIFQAGPSEATVLIMGESGTGKELVAEALHAASNRAGKPLVKVNCAALPANLLESELFGYEKGAFTGASKDKPGRFALAREGTIFLDEIGELPLEIQAKLLRVLQERVIEPLGSVKPQSVDVRVICATNRNLRQEVQTGNFREDLYFRLNVLEVLIPPMRERLEDLPLLVNRLLARLCLKNKKDIRGVTQEFLGALSYYSWPGNVRELENVLERALILSRADILGVDSLPGQIVQTSRAYTAPAQAEPRLLTAAVRPAAGGAAPMPQSAAFGLPSSAGSAYPPAFMPANTPAHLDFISAQPPVFSSPLEEAEYKALVQALNANGGHRERTADALGISRRTLQYKLKRFGLVRSYQGS